MSDTVLVALISGVVSLVINFGSKWLDSKNGVAKDIAEIKESLTDLKRNDTVYGDMVYQMLDHMATSNNTGEMKRALDQYNAFFRKNYNQEG